jgi:hypothetical protein
MKMKILTIGVICLFVSSGLFTLQTTATDTYNFFGDVQDLIDDSDNVDYPKFVVPDYVKPGDILFCEVKDKDYEPGWDHVAMYIGDNEFIEAAPEVGVWITNLNIFHIWAKDITYGTVKTATTAQRQNAIKFAKDQLGKPYDPYKCFFMPWYKRPKDPSPNTEAWSCAELVWAAYYNQGIDIDRDGDRIPYVGTTEISSDDDVEMYTYHKLNGYYPGRNIEWLIKTVISFLR